MLKMSFALLAVLVVLAGCGGDDDEEPGNRSGTVESAPTRAEFIAAGDAICEEVNDKVTSINDRVQRIEDSATSEEQALADVAPILAEAYDLQRDGVAEFRDLTPPPADEETVDKVVAGLEQQTALVGQIAEAADAGSAERLADLGSQLDATRVACAACSRATASRSAAVVPASSPLIERESSTQNAIEMLRAPEQARRRSASPRVGRAPLTGVGGRSTADRS
jgi:hypothetical protein